MRTLLLASCLVITACTGTIEARDAGGIVPVDQPPSGCAMEQLLVEQCISCHGATPSEGAPVAFTSLASLKAASQRDPSKTYAERALIRAQAGEMPPGSPLTGYQVGTIAAWIQGGMPACETNDGGTLGDGGDPSPNLLPQDALFTCVAGTRSDAPTRIRRLDRWQITRNVGGAVTRSWTGFSYFDNPFDPSGGDPYSTWTHDESVDDAMVELFLPIIAEAGPPWAGPYTGDNRLERLRTDTSLRCMYQDDVPSPSCMRHSAAGRNLSRCSTTARYHSG